MKQDFGAFELRKKIGSGGMASVYLGVQKSLDRQVVLKVLYPHLAEDEKLVARFEREARAAAMMRHENIVQVIDCGRHDELSYIAMEFIEGQDLKKWLEAHGAPPLEMALLMLRDILRGVEHAHSHRIVHRDIKPANVMLTPEGAIKIMDFGLARRGEESTQVTVVGTVMGTVAYMSPEQATGEAVDERADIFSTGVVGYELLGGRRPFEGESYSAVLRAVLTVDPPPLESLNPLVPDSVVTLVHKMLHKDVSKRYARAEQVREDLETVIEEMGLHRSRDLLREYVKDPKEISARLRKKHLSRHQDQATYYENLGRGRIQDAIREYRCVLFLDPDDKAARKHLEKLEQELTSSPSLPAGTQAAAAASSLDSTLVLEPDANPGAASSLASVAPAPATLNPKVEPARTPVTAEPRAPSVSAPRPAPAGAAATASATTQADVPPGVLIPEHAPASPAPKSAKKTATSSKPAPAADRERPKPAPVPVRALRTVTPSSTPSQRLRAMLMAAAGLLAVLVVVGIVVVSRGMGGRNSPLPADTAPLAAQPTPGGGPDRVEGSGGAAELPRPGDAAPALPAPPTQGTDRGPTPPADAAAKATLALETTPTEARVRIDGRVQPERSNATFENLTPGTHTIIVEKAGYQDARRNVTFKPGERKRLSLTLVASAPVATTPPVPPPAEGGGGNGTLVVRATPYASYYVNDDLKATNLPTAQIPLKPGAYRVRIVHPEFGAHDWRDVKVESGQRTTLAYDFLSSSTGSVRVTSQGIWASVIVDGQETGKTTPCVLELRLGQHTIELRRPGFTVEGGPRAVTVSGGSTMEVGFRMKSER